MLGGRKNIGNTPTGWWLSHPSEKFELVSWDDYSQYIYIWKVIKVMFQTTTQPSNGKMLNYHLVDGMVYRGWS